MIESAEILTIFLNIARRIYESAYGEKTGGKAEVGGTLTSGKRILISISLELEKTETDEEVHDD